MTVADAPVVQPVLLGGDFGVYALARSFHEAYGVTSIVLSHAPTVAISRSAFCRVEPIVAHASDEELLATLGKLAETMRIALWSLLQIMIFILNLLRVIGIL